jgi:hypothetical protein
LRKDCKHENQKSYPRLPGASESSYLNDQGTFIGIQKYGDALDEEIREAERKNQKTKSRTKSQKLRIHEKLVRSQEPVEPVMSKKFKMSKSDAMIAIAKAVELGKPTTIIKADWYREILNRSEALRFEGQSSPATFSKFITNNPDGQLLFAVYKQAPGKDWTGDAEELDEEEDEENDPAYAKLATAAKELMKTNSTLSFPQAFSKAVQLNPALMRASTAVHRAKINKSYETKPNVPNGEAGNQLRWTPIVRQPEPLLKV